MKFSLLVALSSFFTAIFMGASQSSAMEAGQMAIGIRGGHSGLLQDLQESAGNSLGFGVHFNFAMTEELIAELSTFKSDHDNSISHQDVSVGMKVRLTNYDTIYSHFVTGASFLTNTFPGVSANGFGLYVGGGFDFRLNNFIMAGLTGRYVKAFEVKEDLGSGSEVPALQDSVDVMLQLSFVFGEGEEW